MKFGLSAKEYEEDQKNGQRQLGTSISKKGMRDFVRGLDIRMKSGVEPEVAKLYFGDPEDKLAILTDYFFKFLTDNEEFEELNTQENSPIVTAWMRTGDRRVMFTWNCMTDGIERHIPNTFIPLLGSVIKKLRWMLEHIEEDE